jgi:SAM-dependent methyltransferase
MDPRDAARLIAPAVQIGERWVDLGAGTGTFTVALARLVGPMGSVYAVEREPFAVDQLGVAARAHDPERARIVVLQADFASPLELPPLDGALLANALHFVDGDEQARVLGRIAERLVRTGGLVIVEYDDRAPSRWVPFPVSLARLADLARIAHLGAPEQIGRRRSMFGGSMYAARLPVH